MTRFEEIGVERQENSSDIFEATQNFEKSCERCATLVGRGLSCSSCAIKKAYEDLKELVFLPSSTPVIAPVSAVTTKQNKYGWKKLPIKEVVLKSDE